MKKLNLLILIFIISAVILSGAKNLYALPPTWPSGNYGVCDGTGTTGVDLLYQYAPTTTGAGFIKSNWATVPDVTAYKIKITSGPSITLLDWTNIGNYTSTATYLSGISLSGAWNNTTYYVHIIPVNADGDGPVGTSNGVQIAEKETWDGVATSGIRNDVLGGFNTNWPQSGYDAFYGNHFFETINILANTTCYAQGFGKVESVPAGIASSDAKVTNPKDGWLGVYANNITVSGFITASGRGYGAGGGGGDPGGNRGAGGNNGLGGNGGQGNSTVAGNGGGGSPGGVGATTNAKAGDGNIFGGGGGNCEAIAGFNGGNGAVSNIGGQGTSGGTSNGAGGSGEFTVGGGTRVTGADNQTGAGGGGYGAGGGGGGQWAGATTDCGGGGGGGTGGTGGGVGTLDGGTGCGLYGGAGGAGDSTPGASPQQDNGAAGSNGGYRSSGGNGDSTTGKELYLGSGGGGGGAGGSEAGGGGGAAGGGFVRLVAYSTITVNSSARLLSNGAAGGGGAMDPGAGNDTGGGGGNGAGGAVLLDGRWVTNSATGVNFSARGGNNQTTNGGTIKVFAANTFSGSDPGSSYYGRLYKNVLPSTSTVRDGASTDITFSSVTTYLQSNWDATTIRTAGRSLLRYEFKIGHTPYGSEVLNWTTCGTSLSTTSYQNLQGSRRYFISVRAVDDTGFWGDEATSNGVYIDTITPTQPSYTSPADTSWQNSANITFQWGSSSDGESGLAGYLFEISTISAQNFSTIYYSSETTNVNFSTGPFVEAKQHFWRVRAKDNVANYSVGWSTWTVGFDFTAPTPNPPTGSVNADSPTQITWSATGPSDTGGSGLHSQPYSFDNGGSYQAGATFVKSDCVENTQYTQTIKYRDNAGNQTSGTSFSKYSLPAIPTNSNVSCDKSTETVSATSLFTFNTSFGAGTFQYLRYRWSINASESVSGGDTQWSVGALSLNTPTQNTSYYLHLAAYNGDGAENGTQLHKGPYWYQSNFKSATDTTDTDFGNGLVKSSVTIVGTGDGAYIEITSTNTGFDGKWLNDWKYRRAINISNGGSSGLSDYQVWLPTTSFGSNWDLIRSSAQSTMADFRFTPSTATTTIPYWIDPDTTTANCKGFWVRVSSVPTSGTSIYMYYGNPSANAEQSATNTFIFFDDFSSNPGGWSENDANGRINPDYTTNKRLTYTNLAQSDDNHNYYRSVPSLQNFALNFSHAFTGGVADPNVMGMGFGNSIDDFNGIAESLHVDVAKGRQYFGITEGVGFTSTWLYSENTSYYCTFTKIGTTAALKIYSDSGRNNLLTTLNKTVTDRAYNYFFGVNSWYDGNTACYSSGWFDDFIIRKYAATDPTIGSVGSEEGPYFPAGEFQSRAIDTTKKGTSWGNISWGKNTPINTDIKLKTRTGNTATPDGSWSAWNSSAVPTGEWYTVATGTPIASPRARYIQYISSFTTAVTTTTPQLTEVNIQYSTNTATKPNLQIPENNVWLSSTNPLFQWQFVDGEGDTQTGFRIQLSTIADKSATTPYNFTGNIIHDSGDFSSSVSTYQPASQLNNGQYYWQVRSSDTYGEWSVYSSTYLVKLDTAPPGGYAITSAVAHISSCTINWNSATDPSDIYGGAGSGLAALPYIMRYSTDSNFTSAATTTTVWMAETSSATTNLTPNTTYYFSVKARDSVLNESNWSSTFTRATLCNTPNNPAWGTVFVTSITVTWGTGENPANPNNTVYVAQVSTASNFTGTVFSIATVKVAATTTVEGLTLNTTYYGRVVARNWEEQEATQGVATTKVTLIYTPLAPSLTALSGSSIRVTKETDGNPGTIEYAIKALKSWGTTYYVQAPNTLDTGIVWQQASVWGFPLDTTGLSGNTSYQFCLLARNYSGVSSTSPYSNKTTLANQPSGPGNFYTQYITTYSIRPDWTGNNSAGTTYRVNTSTLSNFGIITSTEETTNEYVDVSSMTANKSYYFRVAALNNEGIPTAFTTLNTSNPKYTRIETPVLSDNVWTINSSSVTINLSAQTFTNLTSGQSGLLFEEDGSSGGPWNSGWISNKIWTRSENNPASSPALIGNTTYAFTIKSRNYEGLENDAVGPLVKGMKIEPIQGAEYLIYGSSIAIRA
ncbi:MAG: DUF2341 domain-containing protein, partial [Elusimicrobiota bacterium]